MQGGEYLVVDTDLCLVLDFDALRVMIPQRNLAAAPAIPHSQQGQPTPSPGNP